MIIKYLLGNPKNFLFFNYLKLNYSKISVKSPYKYTLDNPILKKNQRDFYEENGFLIVKNLVNHSDLDIYKQRFQDIVNGKLDPTGMLLQKDVSMLKSGIKGERLYYKINDFLWDPVFFNYCKDPKIIKYVECFTGPNIATVHTMLVNKPPDLGTDTTKHPLHQDMYYFPFGPAEKIVCAWTAIENVNTDNGCLIVLPGSHKDKLYLHNMDKSVNGAHHGIVSHEHKNIEHYPKIDLEMEKGDTVFFNPMLIHGSGPNKTKGFRKAISSHYADSNCHYINLKGTFQEPIVKEVEERAKRQGNPMSYKAFFKAKARLVKGEPGEMVDK